MMDKKGQFQMRIDDAFTQALIEIRKAEAEEGIFRSAASIIRDLVLKAAADVKVKKERKKR